MENTTQNKFDYFSAGKMQVLMAILAYMHGAYWFNMGQAAAYRVGRVSPQFISALDWTCIALMVLAVVPLFRGIYLMRKGRALGQG